MTELAWDWPEIAVVLMWKLAPGGCVITRKDLARLPMDRVLVEDRSDREIRFSWVTPQEAQRRAGNMPGATVQGQEKASVSQLQGRWQKIAVVLLWKLAKDGCRLTRWDRDQVPVDKTLLAHGHAQDIEYRFVPRAEAERVAKWERDNEGKTVVEAM